MGLQGFALECGAIKKVEKDEDSSIEEWSREDGFYRLYVGFDEYLMGGSAVER